MPDAGEETLSDLVSRIVENAKDVARAEIDLVKVQAADRIAGYRSAAILFVVAGLLGVAAAPALLVGLILTLAPALGAGWATLVVIVGTLALAGLLGWFGLQRTRRG